MTSHAPQVIDNRAGCQLRGCFAAPVLQCERCTNTRDTAATQQCSCNSVMVREARARTARKVYTSKLLGWHVHVCPRVHKQLRHVQMPGFSSHMQGTVAVFAAKASSDAQQRHAQLWNAAGKCGSSAINGMTSLNERRRLHAHITCSACSRLPLLPTTSEPLAQNRFQQLCAGENLLHCR